MSDSAARRAGAHGGARCWLAGAALAVAASGCQVMAPQPPAEPRLLFDAAAVGTATPRSAAVELTHTVVRGTIRETLTLPGRVVTARVAQLAFQASGTVTTVNVRSGQEVKQGDVLAELSLDEEALRQARAQATLAELAADSQEARVRELREGAGPAALAAARASVARAQAALAEAELARQTAAQAPPGDELALARLAVEQARDDLEQARAGAAVARGRQAADVRQAERKVAQAQLKLDQLRARDDAAGAQRELDQQALRVEQARDALEQARLAEERANNRRLDEELGKPTSEASEVERRAAQLRLDAARAAASAAVRAAERTLRMEELRLEQQRADQAAASAARERELKLAQLELEQAQDDLAMAQAGQPPAGEAGAARTTEAAVRAAERRLQMETVKLEAAEAEAATAATTRQTEAELADLKVAAAQEELAAAQAKVQELESGPAAEAIAREEARLRLLQEQADQARRAAQAVAALVAPFDGTVVAVEASPGEAVQARTPVVRLAGQGALSVLADATENDVAHLRVDQTVEVAFPGLGDAVAPGTIVDVSQIASTRDGREAAYPVRVALGATPPALKLGMTALVNVNLREARDVLWVPSNAIRAVDGRSVVTRVDPTGQVTDVPVQLGGTYGGRVEVVSGLEEGDVVAVYPATVAEPAAAGSQRR